TVLYSATNKRNTYTEGHPHHTTSQQSIQISNPSVNLTADQTEPLQPFSLEKSPGVPVSTF
ncbi:hypothetical protein ACQP3L_37565, partial [Escherichia coli]